MALVSRKPDAEQANVRDQAELARLKAEAAEESDRPHRRTRDQCVGPATATNESHRPSSGRTSSQAWRVAFLSRHAGFFPSNVEQVMRPEHRHRDPEDREVSKTAYDLLREMRAAVGLTRHVHVPYRHFYDDVPVRPLPPTPPRRRKSP